MELQRAEVRCSIETLLICYRRSSRGDVLQRAEVRCSIETALLGYRPPHSPCVAARGSALLY